MPEPDFHHPGYSFPAVEHLSGIPDLTDINERLTHETDQMAAYDLFRQRYLWRNKPVRTLTMRGINLITANQPLQFDIFNDAQRRERRRALENAVDDLRGRFGYRIVFAAALVGENTLAQDKCETVLMPGLMYK